MNIPTYDNRALTSGSGTIPMHPDAAVLLSAFGIFAGFVVMLQQRVHRVEIAQRLVQLQKMRT